MPVNFSGRRGPRQRRRSAKDKSGGSDTLCQRRQADKGKGDADLDLNSISNLLISNSILSRRALEEESSLKEDNTSRTSKAEESSPKEEIASSEELEESSQLQKLTLMDEDDEWKPPQVSVDEDDFKIKNKYNKHPPPPYKVEGWEPKPLDDNIGGIPGKPCPVCYGTGHYGCGCPYLFSYPPDGPQINSAVYEIVCNCGSTDIVPGGQSCSGCVPYCGLRVQPKFLPPMLEYAYPGYDCPRSPSSYPAYDIPESPPSYPQYDVPGSTCSYPEYEGLKIQY